MIRARVTSYERLLTLLLVLPSMAISCGTRLPKLIGPYTDVDPTTVEPPDPSEEPTDEYRSIDGTGNHSFYFELGAADTPLTRLAFADYGDEMGSMAGISRPSAREISNALCADTQGTPNELGASDMLWQWGQFVDHDIDLTERERACGARADPGSGRRSVVRSDGQRARDHRVQRSVYHPGTGHDPAYPRQQLNHITHFIDASNVYGSDDVRAAALRTNDGTGHLLVSAGDLLPFNAPGLPNAGGTGPELFLAGDVRANEQVGLDGPAYAVRARAQPFGRGDRLEGPLVDRRRDLPGSAARGGGTHASDHLQRVLARAPRPEAPFDPTYRYKSLRDAQRSPMSFRPRSIDLGTVH